MKNAIILAFLIFSASAFARSASDPYTCFIDDHIGTLDFQINVTVNSVQIYPDERPANFICSDRELPNKIHCYETFLGSLGTEEKKCFERIQKDEVIGYKTDKKSLIASYQELRPKSLPGCNLIEKQVTVRCYSKKLEDDFKNIKATDIKKVTKKINDDAAGLAIPGMEHINGSFSEEYAEIVGKFNRSMLNQKKTSTSK